MLGLCRSRHHIEWSTGLKKDLRGIEAAGSVLNAARSYLTSFNEM